MDDKASSRVAKHHTLNMVDREKLTLTGVKDIFSFDEVLIELETTKEYLDIIGQDLHIIKMNIEEGEVCIEGSVKELNYHEHQTGGKKKGSLLSKLFK